MPPKKQEHKSYYGGESDPFEHVKVVEHFGWGYHIGQATKYIWRAGKKESSLMGTVEDLRKAIWYLERLIQYLEKK